MREVSKLKIRHSVRELEEMYQNDNKKPLEDLMRAWKGIKELPPENPNSFFQIGGYHGEPFVYRPRVEALPEEDTYLYWGGYCNHGNVLFPTWHRIYVLVIEQALQSIVPDVMMPYWDETSQESMDKGIPDSLTRKEFTFSDAEYNGELAGKTIDNPLRSFVLPLALSDDLRLDNRSWAKPEGYETVRYPLSGLVGTPEAREASEKHNAQFKPEQLIPDLNNNIIQWLQGAPPEDPEATTPKGKMGIYERFQNSLKAPNYTVFSNTTSASAWNRASTGADIVVPLEDPHNDIHLAVGGFDMAGSGPEFGIIAGANGDMGENNTAAMDPIFFFHHCNVDRMFWLWQVHNGYTDNFEIISGYYGTSSSDSQGPTPGIAPNTPLNMKTPLNPFKKAIESGAAVAYTSSDCINIETQLNYTYSDGSFSDPGVLAMTEVDEKSRSKTLFVSGIDRATFQGSFVLRAYAKIGDKQYYLGHHSVLSRRNVVHCANCLTHLDVEAFFPLDALPADKIDDAEFSFTIQHRGEALHGDVKFEYKIIG